MAAEAGAALAVPPDAEERLARELAGAREAVSRRIGERNARWFEAEAEKLDGWADDLKVGLDREIKEARRAATAALSLREKLDGQRRLRDLEAERSRKRRSLFDAQDEVDARRNALIEKIEGQMRQRVEEERLFHAKVTARVSG